MPIWIEAATEYVRDLYAKLGFVVVGEWRLGKGKVDEGGRGCSERGDPGGSEDLGDDLVT